MSLRALLLLLLGGAAAVNATPAPFDPAHASISDLRSAIDSGRITSEALTRYYLARIARFDQAGPHINALITVNPEALAQARAADAAQAQHAEAGPLAGIPFIVKDNFDTATLATSGGSAVLADSRPVRNAVVVQRLLDAGAILLGKANMSELAASYGRLGYSSRGGLTLNPFDLRRNAAGSSSGSAAAVAADFAPFALGTDTGGSVRAPAAVTGLVGLRPSIDLLSGEGIIPASSTFDTPGVLARRAADVATVLDVMMTPEGRTASAAPAEHARAVPPPTRLAGLRLGVLKRFHGGNPEIDALERQTLYLLVREGAVLIDVDLPVSFEALDARVMEPVYEAEFRAQFERYLRSLPHGAPRTLREFIERSQAPAVAQSPTPVNPARLRALEVADTTELTDSPRYIHILRDVIPTLRDRLRATFAQQRLTALVFSTMSCPASPRFDREDPTYICRAQDPYEPGYLASVSGFPEITVPVGRLSRGIPAGFSFLGLPFDERRLITLAGLLQSALPTMPPPPLD